MRSILLSSLLLLLLTSQSPAQEPAYRDDLRFAESLRNRGDSDLALEYLQRLSKGAPAELARELPLEFAKTRLQVASDQSETVKRLALYKEAREDFEKFIAANPGHPRNAEANLDIARVLNLQGKTELNRSQLAEDQKAAKDFASQARATLEQAATRLAAATRELEAQLAKLPDPDTIDDFKKKKEAQLLRFPVESDLRQTQLDIGLNLYDRAQTYIGGAGDKIASDLLEAAKKTLTPLADGNPRLPVRWKAIAWLGRIVFETETTDKAHERFEVVRNAANDPAAADGVRLARYFRLKVIQQSPRESDKKYPGGPNALILEAGNAWWRDYPRYHRSPEGCGMAFLLAQTLIQTTDVSKTLAPFQKNQNYTRARNLLRELESSENEFTERARRLKIETMARQGLFKQEIAKMTSFEDLFVRAQYEAFQMGQDQKEAKPGMDLEAMRKTRIANITLALERALALPEVKKMKASTELNTARSMMAYWALNTGKLEAAIKAGETFARDDPRSSQAEMSAVYAMQAYIQLIGQKTSKFEDISQERAGMFSLASYIEERWPRGMASDLARHLVGLQMTLDKEPNPTEAVKKLSLIGPGYSDYVRVCRLVASICNKADKEGVEPISGDRPGDFRKRALVALESMPESALGADPASNTLFMAGKAELGRSLFAYKRFRQMDDMATTLLDKLAKVRFNEDEEKDRGIRNQMRFELVDVKLYARYGLADAAYQAGDYIKVLELLDPIIDAANKAEDSQEKTNMQKNPQVGGVILNLALRSNIQLGKIDRTDQVLDVYDKIATDGGGGGNFTTLRLLAALINRQVQDLRQKGDKETLAKAIAGYSAILDKRVAKQKSSTPEFLRLLADCYASMEQHARAADTLKGIVEPKTPGGDEERVYRVALVVRIRELRLSKTPDNLKEARALLEKIMASQGKKAGWGANDLGALKELGYLWEAEEKYAEAYGMWIGLVKRLANNLNRGGAIKEHYLECYYHSIYSYMKSNLKANGADRDKILKQTAQLIATLESGQPDFGSDVSKKRFMDLFEQEPDLKAAYEALKNSRK